MRGETILADRFLVPTQFNSWKIIQLSHLVLQEKLNARLFLSDDWKTKFAEMNRQRCWKKEVLNKRDKKTFIN